jgi:small GTP-binding protein
MSLATFKICIFGDGGVGKTTLLQRFISGRFKHDTKMTLGVDILSKHIKIKGWDVSLQIWDFGGEERFRFFLPAYARGSSAGIFMYDITRYSTLMDFDDWLNIFEKESSFDAGKTPSIMVGGKLDLDHKRGIFYEEAYDFALSRNIFNVIECSSKTGLNVELIFKLVAYKIMHDMDYL